MQEENDRAPAKEGDHFLFLGEFLIHKEINGVDNPLLRSIRESLELLQDDVPGMVDAAYENILKNGVRRHLKGVHQRNQPLTSWEGCSAFYG